MCVLPNGQKFFLCYLPKNSQTSSWQIFFWHANILNAPDSSHLIQNYSMSAKMYLKVFRILCDPGYIVYLLLYLVILLWLMQKVVLLSCKVVQRAPKSCFARSKQQEMTRGSHCLQVDYENNHGSSSLSSYNLRQHSLPVLLLALQVLLE